MEKLTLQMLRLIFANEAVPLEVAKGMSKRILESGFHEILSAIEVSTRGGGDYISCQ